MSEKHEESSDLTHELNMSRRAVLRGIAVFATAMIARPLAACGPTGNADAGPDAGADVTGAEASVEAGFDASAEASVDAGVDVAADVASDAAMEAGVAPFEPRMMPTPPSLRSLIGSIGPLGAPDADGVRLPAGFSVRVLARGEQRVGTSDYSWHIAPDGGAVFAKMGGGWIYVSNCEAPIVGGVGALEFNDRGDVIDAYRILDGTNVNCAGGWTPWGAWLSCEEIGRGRVWECDPHGERAAVARPALGVFKHEAAAVDPVRAHVYLTEDELDGNLYRYVPLRRTPQGHPDLFGGSLEVASVQPDNTVRWLPVPDPQFRGTIPLRQQVTGATVFNGGEGIWFHNDKVFFTTKGTNQVWEYDAATPRIRAIYTAGSSTALRGVDNVTVSASGDVLVAEDGGSMQIVAIMPDGMLVPLVQLVGQDGSEITGPAFDPSGTRLYFSSQRGGPRSSGITYEITGPFHRPV